MIPIGKYVSITKTQSVLALFILIFEIFWPTEVVLAANRWPGQTFSGFVFEQESIRPVIPSLVMLSEEQQKQQKNKLLQQNIDPPVDTVYMMASAYNSLPWQTDGSPYLTAIGSMTRDGVVASNYFPIGTRLRLPDVFGDKEFRVEDRMNPRYFKTLDIWMEDITDARKFGRRYIKVDVLKYGLGRGVE